MEIDLNKNDRQLIFGDKPTKMKIDSAPLRSCYQRPSDCPLINSDGSLGYTISSTRRRRRSVDDDRDVNIMSRVHFKEEHSRSKRQTTTYDYDAFCDRVLDGSSSSLAQYVLLLLYLWMIK